MKRKRLGELLRERGKISEDSLQQLFNEQQDKAVRLGELILERGLVEKSALVRGLEEVSGGPYLDAIDIECEPQSLKAIPVAVVRRLAVLPIRIEDSKLIVAMAEPQNLAVLDELRFISGKSISPRLAFLPEILQGINKNYGTSKAQHAAGQIRSGPGGTSGESFPEMVFTSTSTRQGDREAMKEIEAELHQKKTPAVRLVTEIIHEAMVKGASDVHIEPQSAATVVRIRVDGVLRELMKIPRNVQTSLISRIKILADMDIGERRAPQDGRFMVA